MKINFNMPAVIASNALAKNENKLSDSLERLSSGLKINSAKDNPAGLAISKKMNAQISGVTRSTQNANDGISVIETAEGGLSEIQDMIHRLSELSVKSASGAITDNDRVSIQAEVDELKKEIERIANETQFNGQSILDGTFGLKAYASQLGVKVETYAEAVPSKEYTISSITVLDAFGDPMDPPSMVLKQDGSADAFPADATVAYNGMFATITASSGFEMSLTLNPTTIGMVPLTDVTIDATGIGSMRLQIGANEGQVLKLNIPQIGTRNLGISDLDVSTLAGANKALDSTATANAFVSQARSRLGAYQNRLEHTISSLDVTNENMTAAYSRIMDVDMATEMTEYMTNQVLTQAGTSMLAQANERPQSVLQLLQ